MKWYDIFAKFYDLSIERFYRHPRQLAFAQLQKRPSSTVLDLACGTGQNFPLLIEASAGHLRLIGVDASEGMLERARRRVAKNKWTVVTLIEADARTLDRHLLSTAIDPEASGVDFVVCTLGLSTMPEWESVFARAWNVLKPGGQFLILDVWAEMRVPQTHLVELIARADLRRKVWEPLEHAADDFELSFLRGSAHFHGGRLFVATGTKPPPQHDSVR